MQSVTTLGARTQSLTNRINTTPTSLLWVSAIAVEQLLRGRLAQIKEHLHRPREVGLHYDGLARLIRDLAEFQILPFDEPAAILFGQFPSSVKRLGSQDCRGIRPAVSPGLSVSRVGSAAQNKVLRKMAGSLKLELAQFREVEDFTKLGFVLDDVTKRLVDRGEKLTKLLVQNRNEPLDISELTLFLYAALNGFLDEIPLNMVNIYEKELYKFLKNTVFYEPLKIGLKDVLDVELISFLLEKFKFFFIANKIIYLKLL